MSKYQCVYRLSWPCNEKDEDSARRVAQGGSVRPVVVGRAGGGLLSKKIESIFFLEKNNLSPPYDLCFWNRLHHCVLCDERNKTRSHLHIFWWYFSLVPSCYMLSHKLSRCLHISCHTCKVRVATTKNSIFCLSCQEKRNLSWNHNLLCTGVVTKTRKSVMHISCQKKILYEVATLVI